MKTKIEDSVMVSGIFASFLKGLTISVVNGVTNSCICAIVKYLKNIHIWQLVLYMNWASMSLALPWVILSGGNAFGPRGYRVIILSRSILAALTMILQNLSFRFIPIVEAGVLMGTIPVFVTVAARIFLKEAFTMISWISVITTMVGIILITGLFETIVQGSRIYSTEDIYGITAALASVGTSTAIILIARKIRNVDASVLTFNGGLVAIIVFSVFTACTGDFSLHYKGLQQVLIIFLGVFTAISQSTLFLALKFMEAGPVSTIRLSSGMIFLFLFQIFIFYDVPNTFKIIGALLVCCSVVLISLSKQINSFFSGKCCTLCDNSI